MPLIREFGHRSRFHPRIGLLWLILYIPALDSHQRRCDARVSQPPVSQRKQRGFLNKFEKGGGERRQARLISGFSVVTISPCYGNSLAREDLIVDFIRPKSDDLHHKNSTRETGFS